MPRTRSGARVRVGGQRFRVIGVLRGAGPVPRHRPRRHGLHPGGARARAVQPRRRCMEINLTYAKARRASASSRPCRGRARGAPRPRGLHASSTQEEMLRHAVEHPRRADDGGGGARQHLAAGRRRRHRDDHDDRGGRAHRRDRPAAWRSARGARRCCALFLGEAVVLSALGGVLGLAVGIGLAQRCAWPCRRCRCTRRCCSWCCAERVVGHRAGRRRAAGASRGPARSGGGAARGVRRPRSAASVGWGGNPSIRRVPQLSLGPRGNPASS